MNSQRFDMYSRGGGRRKSEAVSGLHFVLMFLAAGLLVLTRVEHPLVLKLQSSAREISKPLLGHINGLVRPLRNFGHNAAGYFTVESEFRRLERELATLRQLLEQTSDLAQRNEELTLIANLVRSAPVKAVTGEVIAGRQSPLGRSVTIGLGENDGLRYGQPVFGGGGLFGRVTSVAKTTAEVLMLNDINSRIPVEVGKGRLPALLVGDNSQAPRLVYLGSGDAARAGDVVITSGVSGEFPRGIAVGTVVLDNADVRVKTAADLVPGYYLTVLLYNLPSAGIAAKAGTAGAPERAAATDRRSGVQAVVKREAGR